MGKQILDAFINYFNSTEMDSSHCKCMLEILKSENFPDYIAFVLHYLRELDTLDFHDYVCLLNDCLNLLHYPNLEKYFAKRKSVPSLLQLSRDSIRRVMFIKQINNVNFKTSEGVQRLEIPNVLKDVLQLKRTIY